MHRTITILVTLASLMLAGCQTTNPYTGEQQTSKTAVYSGVGAVTGALLGALVNGKDGALAGAAAGGALGAGAGYYQDNQEQALRQRLQGTGVSVKRVGDRIELVLPGAITFDTGAASIEADFYSVLSSVAEVMTEFDKNLVVVKGFTDSVGSEQRNQQLSQARAKAVAAYLAHQGVAKARIQTVGFGEAHPVASNETPEGRAANRRVEISLEPVQDA